MLADQAPTLASASTGIAAAAVAVPSSTNTGGAISSSDSRYGSSYSENSLATVIGNNIVELQQAVLGFVGGMKELSRFVERNASSITALIGAQATTDKVLKLHTTQIDILTQSVAALKEDARLSKKKFEEIEENQE